MSCFNTCSDDEMNLPPGFRFHPTDEELITHYLSPKILDSAFSAIAIGEVDLNKVEPWDLPWVAKMGEKEWYFFCVKDRKYPTGTRTNRATETGYWKATGKDKEIFDEKTLVGMKKTLVFYSGRAPKGERTNWVMHEYRHEGEKITTSLQNEWVICRVFKKTSGGKKIHISELIKHGDCNNNSNMPQLKDISSDDQKPVIGACVSKNSDIDNYFDSNPYIESFEYSEDQSILRLLLENNGQWAQGRTSYGYEEQQQQPFLTTSADNGCLWNY